MYYTKDADRPLGEWQSESVSGDQHSIHVTDRDEDTRYVVRVQAVNSDGPGIISDPYEVQTGQKRE